VEVSNAEIKIVGAVTDENALEEIENIAKVFAYEQRMKDYMSLFHTRRLAEKVSSIERKKIGETNKFIPITQSRIPVKGLC
jgi:hypothetical protein